jgi:hypothetical protein
MRFLLISLSGPVGICVGRLRRRMLVVLVRGCVNLHVEDEERQWNTASNSRASSGESEFEGGGGRYYQQESMAGRRDGGRSLCFSLASTRRTVGGGGRTSTTRQERWAEAIDF